ncbi:peroxisome proliferator-activated receptor gamma coactivator-related protein 1 [Ambystoma mexicanum]|uniref:peroxisome proliferator-activated receptor gamma coactivator-related protein 1 n=1 Tax=Ambystoma mexicanum TaxID=8296 RepID=UPI0037E952EC
MAARWGTRARKRSIGSMDLFTSSSPLQCHTLEEEGNCSVMSDLGLSSLDTSELLGNFRGYIDPTIISIIEGAGSQSESKGRFDEENELSLLTALTEILDNADDENLSPFDSIPDTELLVAQRDRDNSFQRFLSLSRSPPEQKLLPMDERKGFKAHESTATNTKVENRTENTWAMFPDCLNSTPVRRNKARSTRKGIQRVREVSTLQLSDGEEKVYSPEHDTSSESSDYVDFGLDFIEELSRGNALKPEKAESKYGTLHIINTANVSVSDLVKYMHSYCLPSRTVCIEHSEMDEDFLSNGVVLEIEDCFAVTGYVEHSSSEFPDKVSMTNICELEQMDSKATVSTLILAKECPLSDRTPVKEMKKHCKETTAQFETKSQSCAEESNSSLTPESKDQELQQGNEPNAGLGESILQGDSETADHVPVQRNVPKCPVDKLESGDGEECIALQAANLHFQASELAPPREHSTSEKTAMHADALCQSTGPGLQDYPSLLNAGSEVGVNECTSESKHEIEDQPPIANMKCPVSELGQESQDSIREGPPEDGVSKNHLHNNEAVLSEVAPLQHDLGLEKGDLLQVLGSESQSCLTVAMSPPQLSNPDFEEKSTILVTAEKCAPTISQKTASDCALLGKRKCSGRKISKKILSSGQKKKECQKILKQMDIFPKSPPTIQLQETTDHELKQQHVALPTSSNNPALQESDLLIKQLEQAKRESKMELKLLKASRAIKSRARSSTEHSAAISAVEKKSSPVKRSNTEVLKAENATLQTLVNTDALTHPEQTVTSSKEHINEELEESDQVVETSSISNGDRSIPVFELPADQVQCDSDSSELSFPKESTVEGETTLAGEQMSASPSKDVKPKPLSLKEYRMRMQQRKANAADDKNNNENLVNKWPSIAEPPTELAEIPCLMKPKLTAVPKTTLVKDQSYTPDSPESPEQSFSGNALTAEMPSQHDHDTRESPSPACIQNSVPIIETAPMVAVSQSTVPPCTPFLEVSATPWPPVSSQSTGYPFLPPLPPLSVPCVSSNTFHPVPIPPAPMLTWPPPFPPPPIGPGPFHTYPPGWGACIPPPPLPPPPYWPSVPMPPAMPPLMYCDRGPPLHSSAGVHYPTTMPIAPLPRVDFSSGSLNPPMFNSVEQKTISNYQESSEVLQNSQPIIESPNGQTPVLPEQTCTDHVLSGINFLPLDHGKTLSAAAPLQNGVDQTCLNNIENKVCDGQKPAQQTVDQKVQAVCPIEPDVSPNPSHVPNNQASSKGTILNPMNPQSTNEIVLKIFELLRKAQKPASTPQKLVPDLKKNDIAQKSAPLMAPPTIQGTSSMPVMPSSVQEGVVSKPQKSFSVTMVPPLNHQDPGMLMPPKLPSSNRTVPSMSLKMIATKTLPVVQKTQVAAGPPVVQKPQTVVVPMADVPPEVLKPQAADVPPEVLKVPPAVPLATALTALAVQKPQVIPDNQLQAARAVIPRVHEKSKTKSYKDGTRKRGVIGKEKVIEASDLTSLLEQFEESEAKEEKHCSQSPGDNLAVGSSRFGPHVESKSLDTMLMPGLGSTAELTPPATPPHQPLASITLLGKTSVSNATVQEGANCSPLKTVKLIEAKPLPQNKHRRRSSLMVDLPKAPAIHVGFGDHDYCFLRAPQPEMTPDATHLRIGQALQQISSAGEGSRWNVKHNQSIVIKPIVSLTKQPQSKELQVQATVTASGQLSGISVPCSSPVKSHNDVVPTKDCKDQLDHRTSLKNVDCSNTSVLMSPEASPCNSDGGESRTRDGQANANVSKRSLRCYRKHKDSASHPATGWRSRRTNASRSCSSSCSSSDSEDSSSSFSSSSSSRSRSRSSPPKKRRRYKSRNSHNSRSSSRSSCGSCGRSRGRSSSVSTSYSSRSYSRSYSRSRSRSPYSRRYQYYDNHANYRRRKVPQQERAIDERRVVYIGKIPGIMTRAELKHRFSVFGTIEECNIHFRDQGDNYGFVTYRYTEDAFTAIENGHKLRRPDELPFDLCFGGRRQFCKSNYADLDSNRGDYDPVKNKFESLDFDTLLKQAQKSIRR